MLFAFDLDATLVTDDFTLSNTTRDAVLALREHGHIVTVITGRPERAAKVFLEPLEVHTFYGTDHGARIVGEGNLLHRSEITSTCLQDILVRARADGADVSFGVHDDVFVNNPDAPVWNWLRRFDHRMLPHSAYDASTHGSADKLVMHNPAGHDSLLESLQQDYPDLTYYNYETQLEITGKDGNKGAALARLAEVFNVPQAQTVAFGDGLNDVSMIQWAGLSVSVGPRAHPQVRHAANEHVDAPEQEGVSRWLFEHILGR
ncbi:MAG: HAD hydrolase family protein [Deinococcota bacterium]